MQGCGPGSSSERTRTAITAALRKKLKDLMGEFQNLRQRLQDEYRCAHHPCLPPSPTTRGVKVVLLAMHRAKHSVVLQKARVMVLTCLATGLLDSYRD